MYQNLIQALQKSADRFPRKPFIIYGKKRLTFQQLDQISSYLASGLAGLGLGKGDRVGLWLYNCPEFAIAYFAILKIGCCVVPLNTMLKAQEVRYILEDSQAQAVITSIDKTDESLQLAGLLKGLRHVISFPYPAQKIEAVDFYSLIRKRSSLESAYQAHPDEIAAILYTSGTTGKPKGACLTHKNFITNVQDCIAAIRVDHREKFICILPLFHSFAFTVCFLIPLFIGAQTVIMRSLKPFKRVIRTIIRKRVTIFVGVPSLFQVLKDIKIPWFLQFPFFSRMNPVRFCISGAAALGKETLRAFEKKFKIPLLEGYGLTEAAPVVSLNPLFGKRKPGSIGVALNSVKVAIDNPQGTEQIGELLVQGPNVMKGYLNLSLETDQALKNGWLYTGDMAYQDAEGYLYIVGRKKEMINVRGFNVYPREIEDLLYLYPSIAEAAVVGITHPHKGEIPIAFVVEKKNTKISSKELLHFLRNNLAAYKVPARIEIRQSLPKTPAGKIAKHLLQEEFGRSFS